MSVTIGPISVERMARAVALVHERLMRATAALAAAKVPYAVAGGHAVAAWVSRVDTGAVRNTQDVDLLIRRTDFAHVRRALEAAGFVYRHAAGMDIFLDGPEGKPREAIHLVFAGEKVREHEPAANPDVTDSEQDVPFRVLSLKALVTIKLTAYRDKDRTHLRDLIEVGLVDPAWVAELPGELGSRLQAIFDHPEG